MYKRKSLTILAMRAGNSKLHSRLRLAEVAEERRRRRGDLGRLDALHCDTPAPDDALAHCVPCNLRRLPDDTRRF